jgi:large subunit ribosomal protein L31
MRVPAPPLSGLAHWTRFRFTLTAASSGGRPGGRHFRRRAVKPDIHPDYVETTVTCTCGNTFTTRSTSKNGVIHADVCSACHPFYTGKQKILDTGGRIAKWEQRFGKKTEGK